MQRPDGSLSDVPRDRAMSVQRQRLALQRRGSACVRQTAALLLGGALVAGLAAAAEPARLSLRTDALTLELTPALGGRGLLFARHGHANVLKIGSAVAEQPTPRVDADADDIAYLGHDVWLGPQSGWWRDQDVNLARRDAGAPWPPDPWLSFASTLVREQSSQRVELEGAASPITGVRLRKTFTVAPDRDDSVDVAVTATNIRDRPLSRDLWFNTRTFADAVVYVPVDRVEDVRVAPDGDPRRAPLQPQIGDGLLRLQREPIPADMDGRRGKIFIQPARGWLAAFVNDQLFLIRFALQPRSAIHPEQGQIELYHDDRREVAEGLLELEVHAPLRTLAPGESMQASERWTLLAYPGAATASAQRAFLCGEASQRVGEALCRSP